MLQFLKDYSFLIGAFSGSLAAYILGLLISNLRREKRWLGYTTESRNIISSSHSDLEIKYRNMLITRLDSHEITLRNVGNKSLVNFTSRIIFPDGADIVDHYIECPDGAMFTGTKISSNELRISVDLLAVKEAASIGLTVANSNNQDVKFLARVDGMTVVQLSKRQFSIDDALDIAVAIPFFGKSYSSIIRSVVKLLTP